MAKKTTRPANFYDTVRDYIAAAAEAAANDEKLATQLGTLAVRIGKKAELAHKRSIREGDLLKKQQEKAKKLQARIAQLTAELEKIKE
jgi:hypothetical protein